MKEGFLGQVIGSILLDVPVFGRTADDLIDVIKQIRSNAENIEYSLKLD
jgi:hypothetical protein